MSSCPYEHEQRGKKLKVERNSSSHWIEEIDRALSSDVSLSDKERLSKAALEARQYFDLLLSTTYVPQLCIQNAGCSMVLPVSPLIFPSARFSEKRMRYEVAIILRISIMERVCHVAGFPQLLSSPSILNASQQAHVSDPNVASLIRSPYKVGSSSTPFGYSFQSSQPSQGSGSSEHSRSSSGSEGFQSQWRLNVWTLFTSLPRSGMSLIALELMQRMKREGMRILFLNAKQPTSYLACMGMLISLIFAFDGDEKILQLCSKCINVDGNVSEHLADFVELFLEAGRYARTVAYGCKCVCIIDDGDAIFDAHSMIGQLLDALHARNWGRYFEGIVFSKRSFETDMHNKTWLSDDINLDHRLSHVCFKAVLKKYGLSFNDEELSRIGEVTGYVMGSLLHFLQVHCRNVPLDLVSSMAKYEEERVLALHAEIPLAMSHIPSELHGNVKNAVLMMYGGLELRGALFPCTILHNFMFREERGISYMLKPISSCVALALQGCVLGVGGEATFLYMVNTCRQIFSKPLIFGNSAIGKLTKILIASFIEHWSSFKISCTFLFSRRKMAEHFKNIQVVHFYGNDVPSPSGNADIVFYDPYSVTFPDLDGFLHIKKDGIGIGIQETLTSPLGNHNNNFFGSPNDGPTEASHACKWASKLGIDKENMYLLWIAKDSEGTSNWTTYSPSWGLAPKHMFMSLESVVRENAPDLDVLKMLL